MKRLFLPLFLAAMLMTAFACNPEEEAENAINSQIQDQIDDQVSDDDSVTATLMGSQLPGNFDSTQADVTMAAGSFTLTATQSKAAVDVGGDDSGAWNRTFTVVVNNFDPDADMDTEIATLAEDADASSYTGPFISESSYSETTSDGNTFMSDSVTGTITVTDFDADAELIVGTFSLEYTMEDADVYANGIKLEGGSFDVDGPDAE